MLLIAMLFYVLERLNARQPLMLINCFVGTIDAMRFTLSGNLSLRFPCAMSVADKLCSMEITERISPRRNNLCWRIISRNRVKNGRTESAHAGKVIGDVETDKHSPIASSLSDGVSECAESHQLGNCRTEINATFTDDEGNRIRKHQRSIDRKGFWCRVAAPNFNFHLLIRQNEVDRWCNQLIVVHCNGNRKEIMVCGIG
jgi:hypothetical protein